MLLYTRQVGLVSVFREASHVLCLEPEPGPEGLLAPDDLRQLAALPGEDLRNLLLAHRKAQLIAVHIGLWQDLHYFWPDAFQLL